jgi:hypothetical protein
MRGGGPSPSRTGLHYKFPANREKYTQIARDIGVWALFPARIDCEIGTFGEIPYAKEQGMFGGITGKVVLKAGNFSPHACPLAPV